MVYGYLRVSKEGQDEVNQKLGVDNCAKKKELVIDKYVIDHAMSGTISYKKRNLGELIDELQKGDVLIVSELSRLSRKLYEIFELLKIMTEKGVHIYAVKENFELHDDIQSKILAFAFGLSAEIERNMISERTKEALARKKAEGVHIGRIEGSHNSYNKFTGKEELIKKMLKQGYKKCQIAEQINVHRVTFYRYLKKEGFYDGL